MVDDICEQLRAGDKSITGVMIESHINAGRQDVPPEGPGALKHGISITDACVDWNVTVEMLDRLNEVRLNLCSMLGEMNSRIYRLLRRDVTSSSRLA